jgi:hypothetical protein
MGWIIFFILSMLIFLVTSLKKWKRFWFAGVITMIIIYAIDATLIALGAFSYRYPNALLGGLPTFYWLSSFFGGNVLVYYYPQRIRYQFAYILFSCFLFLLLELVMYYFGYFSYHHWSPIKSFFLDVFGFVVVIWIWNWIHTVKMEAD